MKATIDLDYVYDHLGGPARLRRNFPRESQFGSPSLDEQCAVFPWSIIRPALARQAPNFSPERLSVFWPHIARALHEFYYQPSPHPQSAKKSGPRALTTNLHEIARLIDKLELAFAAVDDATLDLKDERDPDQVRFLNDLRMEMWAGANRSKRKAMQARTSTSLHPAYHRSIGPTPQHREASTAVIETKLLLDALKISALNAADASRHNAERIKRKPGKFSERLFLLLEAMARVWIKLTGKLPSQAIGKPGSRTFTAFVLECIPDDQPEGSRSNEPVNEHKVAKLAKLVGSHANAKLQTLERYAN